MDIEWIGQSEVNSLTIRYQYEIMNIWLLFALLAPLLWGLTNVVDGALRRHFIKSNWALTWMTAITRLPFVILFFLIGGFEIPSISVILVIFLGGVLWTFPMLFYYKSIEKEDPSRIALLLQLVPIFTLAIAFFALSERLTDVQLTAFVLLIIGGSFAALKRLEGVWHFSSAFFWMALACLLWASSDVIFKKFETFFSNFFTAFAVYFFGSFMVSFLVFLTPKINKKVVSYFFRLPLRAWVMIALTATAGVGGSISFAYALTLGKASLTSVIIGAQPLLVLGLGILLTPFVREIQKEDLSRKTLLLKGVSFLFILIGLILLQA